MPWGLSQFRDFRFVSVTRRRRALVDRVAHWIAEHGDGELLELRWGHP